jgi:2-oxoglutarate ferredoxin oxidoreductase subunit gamma
MNLPSLEKFAPRVKPEGLIVVNTTLVHRDPERPDCTVVLVESRRLAEEAGTVRAANFAMLGAYVGASGVVQPASVEAEIGEEFSGRRAKHVPANVAAFQAGWALGSAVHAEHTS